MKKITPHNIHLFNENVRYEDPFEIVAFALEHSERPVITTSFGPYSAAILFTCTEVKPDIPVIWCDTGYNTEATYLHAKHLKDSLHLNLDIFTPKYTTAFLNAHIGMPTIENPKHERFSNIVKLDPFDRAFEQYQPDVWFTNVRAHQTEHRDQLDVFSFSSEGILKVSPFYHYSNDQLATFIKEYNLPIEHDYFDPVKAMQNRECGIHLKH